MSRKILAIAGDCAVGRTCQQMLRPEEFHIEFCENPMAAVQTVLAGDFEVVLVCETTVGLDPIQFLRQLREAAAPARVIVLGNRPSVEAAVAAIREGAADYLHEPCSAEELQAVLRRIDAADVVAASPDSGRTPALRDAGRTPSPPCDQGFEGMLGACPAMHEVFALIKRIAPADSTVLVAGESGTGKEMVARAIHQHSRRRDCPLLACDCTAWLPRSWRANCSGTSRARFPGRLPRNAGFSRSPTRARCSWTKSPT